MSHLLAGRQYVRVEQGVLFGRNGGRMHIVIDRVHRTALSNQGPGSRVDEMVLPNEVAAIEVYPGHASTPVELQVLEPSDSCGMVVIWTGGRRE